VCLSQVRYKTKSKQGLHGERAHKSISFFRIIKCRIKACQWATKWSIAKHSNIYYQLVNRTFSALPTGWPKKFGTLFVRFITSSNIDQFSNFFHSQKEKICNNTITKRSRHTSSVSLHYSVKYQCLKSDNWKKSPVTTHFKSASSSSKADTLNILM